MREMVCLLQIIIGFYDFGRNAALKRLDSRLNRLSRQKSVKSIGFLIIKVESLDDGMVTIRMLLIGLTTARK